jgi:multiple sugar transport system permease protein
MQQVQRRSEVWFLIFPAILLLSVVLVLPFLQTVSFSFTNAEMSAIPKKSEWVGFDNYVWALTDPYFREALGRTMYFTVVSVGLEGLLGIAVAISLQYALAGMLLATAFYRRMLPRLRECSSGPVGRCVSGEPSNRSR